jgi:hypothetical protein
MQLFIYFKLIILFYLFPCSLKSPSKFRNCFQDVYHFHQWRSWIHIISIYGYRTLIKKGRKRMEKDFKLYCERENMIKYY